MARRRRTTLHPVVRAFAAAGGVVALVATAACGDDDGEAGGAEPGPAASADEPAEDERTDPLDGSAPPGAATAAEVDQRLLAEAVDHVQRQLRGLVPEALDRPIGDFARTVDAVCRAAAEPAATPAARAEAAAAAVRDGPDVPRWRGTALAVATQYLFLEGCAVPDRTTVVEALGPHVTAALTAD